MAIQIDPEGNETRELLGIVDLTDQNVLEIGCGDGRLTWRYAEHAGHVTAIDPSASDIEQARQDLPADLKGRVEFEVASFEDFAAARPAGSFDIALLSSSLC